MMEPILVSVQVAQKLLGVGNTKFYALMDAGELETVRIGRKRLVRTKSLRAFVDRLSRAQQEREAEPTP